MMALGFPKPPTGEPQRAALTKIGIRVVPRTAIDRQIAVWMAQLGMPFDGSDPPGPLFNSFTTAYKRWKKLNLWSPPTDVPAYVARVLQGRAFPPAGAQLPGASLPPPLMAPAPGQAAPPPTEAPAPEQPIETAGQDNTWLYLGGAIALLGVIVLIVRSRQTAAQAA